MAGLLVVTKSPVVNSQSASFCALVCVLSGMVLTVRNLEVRGQADNRSLDRSVLLRYLVFFLLW